jgi:hypothetical protein
MNEALGHPFRAPSRLQGMCPLGVGGRQCGREATKCTVSPTRAHGQGFTSLCPSPFLCKTEQWRYDIMEPIIWVKAHEDLVPSSQYHAWHMAPRIMVKNGGWGCSSMTEHLPVRPWVSSPALGEKKLFLVLADFQVKGELGRASSLLSHTQSCKYGRHFHSPEDGWHASIPPSRIDYWCKCI